MSFKKMYLRLKHVYGTGKWLKYYKKKTLARENSSKDKKMLDKNYEQ